MKVYYAHCIALYDTVQERRDVMDLETLGFEVVNPNSAPFNGTCAALREEVRAYNEQVGNGAAHRDASAEIMDRVFVSAIRACGALAFRALPGGAITAGVAKEIAIAEDAGLPIIELPGLAIRDVLSVDETRAYLRECGQR